MRKPIGRNVAARLLGPTVALAWLSACSARAPVPDPLPPDEPRRSEIEALVRCGSHDCLTRAFALAREHRRREPTRHDLRADAARVGLLLALRERQLGILGEEPLATARELLERCGDCCDLRLLADGVELLGVSTGGVHEDLARTSFDWRRHETTRDSLERWREEQRSKLRTDSAAVAFCLGLALPVHPGGQPSRAGLETRCDVEAHDESPLVLFSRAMARGGDANLAGRALSLEPSFQEAHLLIGHWARGERRLGVAEEHYRRAFEALPRSVAAGMALADVSFSLEAWPQALTSYERVVTLAPEHREAHLRLGIVLTLLGRSHEAVAELGRLLDLGFWFLGEAHYWLARNRAEIGPREEATHHVGQAAHYLPDDPRVHELSGRLAHEVGAVESAEADYLRVVEIDSRWPGRYAGHDALCDSLQGLARIASASRRWEGAADRFEQAAECQEAAAELVAAEIAAIRTWQLSPSREARLVQRKERASLDRRLRMATAFYNAAACAFNAGERVRATALAERAAQHPQYAEKADALITRILAAF